MPQKRKPMPSNGLTANDCAFILESLSYTKRAFSNYADYPSYAFKTERIAEVDAVISKVRAIRDSAKEEPDADPD